MHFRSAFVPHDLPAPIAGAAQGPLAGLTVAVKDMYDIAGTRTEPPVSLPSAKSHALAAAAAAEPLEEPPGSRPGARGLIGVP